MLARDARRAPTMPRSPACIRRTISRRSGGGAQAGPGRARRGHVDVAGHLRGRAARRRRRGLCRRRGDERQGPQRLRRHPPARPSRRGRDRDGLLLLQQRRHRRPARPGGARRRARRDHGFRRPPRQRHPAHLLGRPDRDVRLDPRDAALSRHGRASASAASTTRSSTRRCAPATAARLSARRWRRAILPRIEAFAPDLDHHLGRLRRACRDPLGNLNSSRPISPGRRGS